MNKEFEKWKDDNGASQQIRDMMEATYYHLNEHPEQLEFIKGIHEKNPYKSFISYRYWDEGYLSGYNAITQGKSIKRTKQ